MKRSFSSTLLRTLPALLLSWFNTQDCRAADDSVARSTPVTLQKTVTVQKNAPLVERRVFQPWNPFNAGPKLNPGEKALTEYAYNLGVRFDVDVVDEEEKHGRWFIHLRPKNGVVKLSLNIKIWTPQWAPQKCIRHEEGHKTICERVYEYAGDIVKLYAEEIQGKTYPGEGGSKEQAEHDAYKRAAGELNQRYRETVFEYAKRVTEEYDRITAHGLNPIAEDAAIQEAFSRCASLMTTELEAKQSKEENKEQLKPQANDSQAEAASDDGSPEKNEKRNSPLVTPLKP